MRLNGKYKVVFTKQAQKDIEKVKQVKALEKNCKLLIALISDNPFKNPPPYEKLIGNLQGAYSRRINIQHRLVYMVYEQEKVVKVISLWTHYE